MPMGIGPGLGVARGGAGAKLKPGEAFLNAFGRATANFVAATNALLTASGSSSVAFVGGGTGGGTTTASLDFSDPNNSQYVALLVL